MRYLVLTLLILSLFACKQSAPVPKTPEVVETPPPPPPPPTPIKEALFITMERTPCLGRCPSYKITIFNTGNVIYEGRDFAEKQGKHTTKLTAEQLDELKNNIEIIDLFKMQNKYDKQVTDIPSCYLYVQLDGKKKKIMDRVDAPAELRNFEKLIDFMVITDQLKPIEE